MADCSCELDGEQAFKAGADVLGSTLAGYTGGVVPTEPDVDLLVALRRLTPHVIAEGRYNTPEKAALAISHGAWAVVVGSAITRTEHVTGWFAEAIRHVSVPCEVDQ
jgi:putative N-acetylmannosamine-6-phosphate epimerase